MIIRPFHPDDLPALDEFDGFAGLQLRWHGGLKPENAFCAYEADLLLGVGFFILPTLGDPRGLRKAELSLSIRQDAAPLAADEARSRLLDAVLVRYRAVRADHPETNMILRICTESGDLAGMAFHLSKGASLENIIPVLAYDLYQPAVHHALPEGVRIEPLTMDDAGVAAYISADLEASDVPDSEMDFRFRAGNPSFRCHVARHGDEVVGSVSIWDMGEERGATENIFVAPAFRRKNVARALIETAFDALRERGRSVATLSVMGTNLPALKLYLGMGYKLSFNLVEMVYR